MRKKRKLWSMKDPIFQLCDRIRETCFSLHQYLRQGHAEKVYENGLVHRLRKQNFSAIQQAPLNVCDEDGALLGEYYADLFIESSLIIELKATRSLADEHIAQLLGYLRASGIEHGLLVNFGSPKLEIRKLALSPI